MIFKTFMNNKKRICSVVCMARKKNKEVSFPDPELEKLYQKMAEAIRKSGTHIEID